MFVDLGKALLSYSLFLDGFPSFKFIYLLLYV